MSRKRGRDDDGDAAPRRQADRAARQSSRSKVLSVAKLEEQRLNHLMNLDKDNYMDADDVDDTNKGAADDASDDDEDEGRVRKKLRSNSTGGIANRTKFPLRKGKVTRETARTFSQILELEDYKQYPVHVPTYLSIAARASSRPARKFSKMSGHLAPYTDPETGTRFASMREYAHLKEKAQ